jgi:hypothetical protein
LSFREEGVKSWQNDFEYEVLPNGRCRRLGPVQEKQELSIIERFREQHHAVARMFAAGFSDSMIRQKTGISLRRLTLLWNDPSFQELIAVYSQRVEDKWNENIDVYLDLGMSNMLRAEAQIAEHIEKAEEADELLPLGMLNKISQDRADRFGYSKHTIHHHEHDFATALDKAIARSGKQIEGRAAEVKPLALPHPREVQEVSSPPPSPAPSGPRSFSAVLNPIKRRKVA